MDQRGRIEQALRSFGCSGKERDEAYSVLYSDGHRILSQYLRSRCCHQEEAEEIIQNTFVRILDGWGRLQFENAARWYAYLYEAVRNGLKDRKPLIVRESQKEIADPAPDPERIIAGLLDRDRLFDLADRTWLGEKPADAVPKRLAAQQLYVDGKSRETVFAMVAVSSAHSKPSSVSELETWLSDLWVIRHTGFEMLYLHNDALAAGLLGNPRLTAAELDALGVYARTAPSDGAAPGGWNWVEVELILLRFRFGFPLSYAANKLTRGLHYDAMRQVNERCTASFPFKNKMVQMWQLMENQTIRDQALSKNALWKRLVFQYHCLHELSQEDIIDRISDAAGVAGYALRNINTWIAGRLASDLLSRLKGERH